jgi:choline dehydrogenase-like flavoprotein
MATLEWNPRRLTPWPGKDCEDSVSMIIDFRTVTQNTPIETDICIVGAGAAGIALARELLGTHVRVCLIESGGLTYDPEVEALNDAENAGELALRLEYNRARFLGGTTNLWGGSCAPLDPLDFEERPWIPDSGWPIGRADLDPYLDRARPYFQLPDVSFEPRGYAREQPEKARLHLQVQGGDLAEKIVLRSPRVPFGVLFRPDLEAENSNLTVMLHANGLRLETDDAGKTVHSLQIGSLDGRRAKIRARIFILAGGIENARLLLLSDHPNPAGLGNGHDTVGRYFCDHLNMTSGRVLIHGPADFVRHHDIEGLYDHANPTREPVVVGLQPTPEVQKREEIGNYLCFISETYQGEDSAGFLALRRIIGRIKRWRSPNDFTQDFTTVAGDFADAVKGTYGFFIDQTPLRLYKLHHFSEQVPNRDSRIMLGGDIDALGLRRMRVAWNVTAQDKRTVVRSQRLVAQEIGRLGLGRVEIEMATEDDPWPDSLHQSSHYMGTTRMSNDPARGVVDANCRVHGVSNLYVAGGSVFPTGGGGMVTFNIVALAIRLADHLKTVMA